MAVEEPLDLVDAIHFYQQLCPQNLSISERRLLERLCHSSPEEQRLIQKLYLRRPRIFRTDSIEYFSKEVLDHLCTKLEQMGWVWTSPSWLPLAQRIQYHSVDELKIFCKELGLKRSGKKDQLIERLCSAGFKSEMPLIVLRNKGLLQRICLTYLRDHQANLNTLILDRLNIQSYAHFPYQKTTASPIHKCRGEFSDYRFQKESTTIVPPTRSLPLQREQFRFSSLRFYHENLYHQAQRLEKKAPSLAIQHYQTIRRQRSTWHSDAFLAEVYHRLALCLDRANQSSAALQVLRESLEQNFDLPHQLILTKTGRRIAHRLRKGFSLPPPLSTPKHRKIRLSKAEKRNNRLYYHGSPVEIAVLEELKTQGRSGIWAENGFWTMLFSLIMIPAMFSPVDNMLPSSILRAPIDFQTRDFYTRREDVINPILQTIQRGEIMMLLEERKKYQGLSIRGIDWERFSYEELISIVSQCPASAIHTVFTIFLNHPESAFRGLPDLLVFSGEAKRISSLFPSLMPDSFLFIEVKSPNDLVSVHQRAWFHYLLSHQQQVEVWNVFS